MRGAFFVGADAEKKFCIKTMEFPAPGPREVLVRNMACGVCGTDVHIYHGEKGSAEVTPPVVLGHEYAGIVEAVGSEVTLVKPGDHVAIDPNMYCGVCMPCRMGKKQNCEKLFALGVNVNGGFAEYSLCPESQCFPVSREIPFDEAAMAEPLACVIHGIDQAQIRPGQVVLVIGGGTIGLLMVQMAKMSGASTVILSEPIEMRRQIGLSVGADAAIDPLAQDVSAAIHAICGRNGADIVLECVGKPFTVQQAIDAADFNANIVLFGVPAVDAVFPLPLFDMYKKELHLCGSMINPDTHQRAVNLINSGRLHLRELITHHFDLEHMDEAIRTQMGSESIKVIVTPQEA